MSVPITIAEVLDKEPTLAWIWSTHLPVALLGYWACRKSWWWLAAFVPLSIYAVWFGSVDLWDRFVGSALFAESPSLYIQWHIAMALVVVAPLLGALSQFRARRSPANSR